MQDMSQPPSYQGPAAGAYQTDKVLGIIIMVLSVCGVIGGGMAFLGGGLLAAGGATAAAGTAGSNAAGSAALAGAGGAFLMIISVVLIISSLIGFAVGYGIMKSLRWGFLVGAIVYGLNTLLQLFGLSHPTAGGVLGLLIVAALC